MFQNLFMSLFSSMGLRYSVICLCCVQSTSWNQVLEISFADDHKSLLAHPASFLPCPNTKVVFLSLYKKVNEKNIVEFFCSVVPRDCVCHNLRRRTLIWYSATLTFKFSLVCHTLPVFPLFFILCVAGEKQFTACSRELDLKTCVYSLHHLFTL